MTVYDKPLPKCCYYKYDMSIATRSPDESGPISGSFVLGNELVVRVCDVRTGEPITYGAYIKSCKITCNDTTEEYRCLDEDRFPRADRFHDDIFPKDTEPTARARQKKRFYQYVTSSLKRLGAWDGPISEKWSKSLEEKIIKWYQNVVDKEANDIDKIVVDLSEHIELALAGRDHVDRFGYICIPLPTVSSNTCATVRLEFHDIKLLKQDDVDELIEDAGLSFLKGSSPGNILDAEIVYDRNNATWMNQNNNDPDLVANESSEEFSNWSLEITTKDTKKKFRNFAEFQVTLSQDESHWETRNIYALTWCQPVWFKASSFVRYKAGPKLDRFTNPVGPPMETTLPAIPTLLQGTSIYNYGICGLFRGWNGWRRLHPGIDIAGLSKGNNRTPVFAIHGGRVWYEDCQVYYRDKHFIRYGHMQKNLATLKKWVKAGTLFGIVGRAGFPNTNLGKLMPTHVHVDTMLSYIKGWHHGNATKLADTPEEGENILRAAAYSAHPDVWKCTKNKKFIKYQWGKWVRDPTTILPEWINDQLGPGGFEKYKLYMPLNWPSAFLPPCKGEYDENNAPHLCTCSCKKEDGQVDSAQAKWAEDCWAVKTSAVPESCACPELSKRGLGECFTKLQRIRYHLWRLIGYVRPFVGTPLNGQDFEAIDNARGWFNQGGHAPALTFLGHVREKTNEIVKWYQDQENKKAEDAKKRGEEYHPKTITVCPRHRRCAIKIVLKEDANIDLILDELESAGTP